MLSACSISLIQRNRLFSSWSLLIPFKIIKLELFTSKQQTGFLCLKLQHKLMYLTQNTRNIVTWWSFIGVVFVFLCNSSFCSFFIQPRQVYSSILSVFLSTLQSSFICSAISLHSIKVLTSGFINKYQTPKTIRMEFTKSST